jgi:limonene-1,2-epoxide hydrolase
VPEEVRASIPAETVEAFIGAFIAAWPQRDAVSLSSFFREDAVHHNGPISPVTGRGAMVAAFTGFMALGGEVRVDMTHMVADGSIVMTERVDHFIGLYKTISLPVMGIIEVHDGVITAWRDYFDIDSRRRCQQEAEPLGAGPAPVAELWDP